MIRQFWNRRFRKRAWHDLRSTTPVSRVFGLDRGEPIDRYYIRRFLGRHRQHITGRVLEVAEDTYTRQFGHDVTAAEILHVRPQRQAAVIVGDLTDPSTLPANAYDCFVCTQTLNFIAEPGRAVAGIHSLLRPGGVVVATVAGVCQISRYDMERWGDYWRFTTASASRLFGETFGKERVSVTPFGNVLSAVALLEGFAVEELTPEELDVLDEDYQVVIGIVATKSKTGD